MCLTKEWLMQKKEREAQRNEKGVTRREARKNQLFLAEKFDKNTGNATNEFLGYGRNGIVSRLRIILLFLGVSFLF